MADFLTSLLGYVPKSLYDANTILYAVTDDTPVALTVPASTIVGRKATGNIAALTGAEILAILSGQASAAFSFNSQEITNATLNALVLKGTFTASGTVILPGFTMSDAILGGGGYSIYDLGEITGRNAAVAFLIKSHQNTGIGAGGGIGIQTLNAAGDAFVERVSFQDRVDTAAISWASATHTGLNITSGEVLKLAGTQIVGARVVDAGIDDSIEAGFTTSYPNASAVLSALQAGIQAHGLITPS